MRYFSDNPPTHFASFAVCVEDNCLGGCVGFLGEYLGS